MQVQIDASRMQFAEESDEIQERPAEPIDRPGSDHLKLAAQGILAEPIEGGPLLTAFGAGNAMIQVDPVERPIPVGGDPLQFPALVFGGLSISRDPQIKRDAL